MENRQDQQKQDYPQRQDGAASPQQGGFAPPQPQQQPYPPQQQGGFAPPQPQQQPYPLQQRPPQYGAPPYGSPPPPRYSPYPPIPARRPRREVNLFEVLSIVLGALALVSAAFLYVHIKILGLVFGILGVVFAVLSKQEGKYEQLGIWGLVVSLFSSGLLMFLIFKFILEEAFHIYM